MFCELDYSKDRRWEGDYLKEKCMEVGVEEEYNLYQIRIRIYYLGVFVFLHWLVVLMHCTFLLTTCEYQKLINVDVVFYVMAAVLITAMMCIDLKEQLVIKYNWIMYVTSVIAVLILVAVDLLLNVYHYHEHDWITGSFYDTYVILMIYMFLPIPKIWAPLGLGILVSSIFILYYITYVASKYRYEISNSDHVNQMVADISHHICLHLLGVFFRVMREIVVRSSFLDRHQFVMEDIWLRNARAQEKVFLHSILPQQISQPIQDEIRDRIAINEKHQKVQIGPLGIGERIMSIQNHPDVTILYADIVNYTHLTTTLSVKNLVTLLHNLYGRFDKAASHFNVQRIKFLGDCYYCVAGLISPDPDHAKWCVELGLCMIKQIRDVRVSHNVEIDIRVGVHSGAIFAGVLGAAKLQYDIWGTDVVIANRLEGTGLPGHIHVSERTISLILDHMYQLLPCTEKANNDPVLIKHGIATYLIAATDTPDSFYDSSSEGLESVSFTLSMQMSARSELNESRISLELRNEFQKMPVGPSSLRNKFKLFFHWGDHKEVRIKQDENQASLRFFLLDFTDPNLEHNYMREPDYMLKYSILLAWCMSLCLITIELLFRNKAHRTCYYIGSAVILSLSTLLFITWYKKICYWRYSEGDHKYTSISCFLFRISENIQCSLMKRVCIYLYTIIVYFLIIFIMLSECDLHEFQVLHIESKLYLYEADPDMCFQPWVLTNMVCLIIGMTLIFTRIPFMMKVVVTIFEIVSYMVVVFYHFQYIVHNSLTTNPFFMAEYAHCILIVITGLIFYLMERQTEFNNKINFRWRVELKKKQRDARLADQSISVLLHNILPSHVVDIYLTSLARHELYYEDYDMVAVMFATLINFELDLPSLRVLNEIISEFDRILSHYKDEYSVEKIKIVGCTYMAACGLDIRLSSTVSNRQSSKHESIAQEVLRAQRSLDSFNMYHKQETKKNEDVVFVLTAFALDLMRTLWMCNMNFKTLPSDREMFSADIRIGISSGEVMAGVVGASQVHYDIWGNAVNMASRMDSTGLTGHIQVTDETANTLRKCGVRCNYRGMTFVKGRGILPTYFVGIDENYNFQYINESWSHRQHSNPSSSTELSYAE